MDVQGLDPAHTYPPPVRGEMFNTRFCDADFVLFSRILISTIKKKLLSIGIYKIYKFTQGNGNLELSFELEKSQNFSPPPLFFVESQSQIIFKLHHV